MALLALQAILSGPAPAAPAPDPRPAVDPSPLETAKRDLEATKGGNRGQAVSPGLADLGIAFPAPPSAGPATGPVVPTRLDKNALTAARRNWLVEAMERKGDGVRGGLAAEGKTSSASTREALRDDGGRSDDRRPEGPTARRDDGRGEESRSGFRREDDVNPFSRYLQGWVSPQDFALLQSTLAAGRSAVGDKAPEGNNTANAAGYESTAGGTAEAGLAAVLGGVKPTVAQVSGPAKQGENPFLQFLSGEPAPSRIPVPTAPVVPSILAPPPSTPPPAASSRGALPEFVRPTTDEKLFRQLKRF